VLNLGGFKMTVKEIKSFIETATNPDTFYSTIYNMLCTMDSAGRYPSDHTIKELQRMADHKFYTELYTE
jgi:hypothetical protein